MSTHSPRTNVLLVSASLLLAVSIVEFIMALVLGGDGPNIGAGFALFAAVTAVVAALFGYGLLIPMRRGPRILVAACGTAVLAFGALFAAMVALGILEEFTR